MARRVTYWFQPPEQNTLTTDSAGKILVALFDNDSKMGGLGRINLADGDAELLSEGLSSLSDTSLQFEVSRDGTIGYFVSQTASQPPAIWKVDTTSGASELLFSPNPECGDIAMGSPHLIEWDTVSGATRKGALMLPPDYVEGTRIPTIVAVYAGYTYSDEFHYFGFTSVTSEYNAQCRK